MATELEVKARERKELLDEIRRRRAAAAQAEGSVRAAEEGQYGDVGQGGPKGEFDDEIDQDPGNEDPSKFSIVSPEAKTAIANYFTTAQPFGSVIGTGVEGLARIQEFLADKQIPFTDKDVTDIFMIISQAPDREKFTKEDVGEVIGMGQFVTEDMVGQDKPLTITQVPAFLGNFLFGETADTMKKVRDEGLTFDEMSPGQRLAMAGGAAEFTPLGLVPDAVRLTKAGVSTGIKAIDELTAPLTTLKTEGGADFNINLMGGVGSGGKGGGAGLSAKGLQLAEQRKYVNKKLKEIYDNAPIDPDTKLPMLPERWYSSKETIEQIYRSNPDLFPEWKDGVGGWNSLTKGFLAGKFVTNEAGQKVYTGDKVTYADTKLFPVSKASSASDKATKDFQQAVATKLNVDYINPQDQTLKYLNFIRLSESEDLFKNPNAFFKEYKFEDLNVPGTKLNDNFEKFKILDNKRIELRDDPEIQALIKKIFPDTEVKFDIAHTFESSGVRTGKVSKSLRGAGGDPDKMYIDLSIINRGKDKDMQKALEAESRTAEEFFTATGIPEFLDYLKKISGKMADMGVEGQTVTKVGDLQSGFILGKKGETLSDKLTVLAKRQGVELTDEDYATMLRADNIINPPKEIMQGDVQLKNRGGMMSIFDMTRPLV